MTVEELRKKKIELMKQQKYTCIRRKKEAMEYVANSETLEEILDEVDTDSAIFDIQEKIEEIMIFLVKNNIYFDAITLFNVDCFAGRADDADNLKNANVEDNKILMYTSEIAPNILPISLYNRELADTNQELQEQVDFLNGELCIDGLYAEFDEFIANLHKDGYKLLYINQLTEEEIELAENHTFRDYLLKIAKGYQLAIRATFPEQSVSRTLEKN